MYTKFLSFKKKAIFSEIGTFRVQAETWGIFQKENTENFQMVTLVIHNCGRIHEYANMIKYGITKLKACKPYMKLISFDYEYSFPL